MSPDISIQTAILVPATVTYGTVLSTLNTYTGLIIAILDVLCALNLNLTVDNVAAVSSLPMITIVASSQHSA